MDELLKMLGLARYTVPDWHNKPLFSLICHNRFEAYTNEAWDIQWTLELPTIPFYVSSEKVGWYKGADGHTMSFKGKTPEGVIRQAVAFLKWYMAQTA